MAAAAEPASGGEEWEWCVKVVGCEEWVVVPGQGRSSLARAVAGEDGGGEGRRIRKPMADRSSRRAIGVAGMGIKVYRLMSHHHP